MKSWLGNLPCAHSPGGTRLNFIKTRKTPIFWNTRTPSKYWGYDLCPKRGWMLTKIENFSQLLDFTDY